MPFKPGPLTNTTHHLQVVYTHITEEMANWPCLTVSTTNNKDTTLITSDKLRDYLTVDNVLTLRYEPNYIQTDSTMVLPKISYWKDGE